MHKSTLPVIGKNAVILSAVRDNNVDKTALKNAGIHRLRSFTSGREGLEAIAGGLAFKVDFIILAGQLEDMASGDFLQALALLGHKHGQLPPVLAICENERAAAKALALGARSVLVRPYATGAMNSALEGLAAADTTAGGMEHRQKFPQACAKGAGYAAEAAVDSASEPDNPLLYRRNGLALLRKGKTREAEKTLRAALEYDQMDLEAAIGIAKARLTQGDTKGAERWRHHAAYICLETGQVERATQILEHLPNKADDPYLTEARYLLREERYDKAVEVFLQACARQKSYSLHLIVSRASQFTDAPEQSLRQMCRAFSRQGYHAIAGDMARRFFSDSGVYAGTGQHDMLAFTFLQEVWAVARYTFKAFRSAA